MPHQNSAANIGALPFSNLESFGSLLHFSRHCSHSRTSFNYIKMADVAANGELIFELERPPAVKHVCEKRAWRLNHEIELRTRSMYSIEAETS